MNTPVEGGYHVNLDALREAVKYIRQIKDELVDLGMDGDQLNGSAIENLALDEEQASSTKVSTTWNDLLERAHYELRENLTAVDAVVSQLADTSSTYERQEEAERAHLTWNPNE